MIISWPCAPAGHARVPAARPFRTLPRRSRGCGKQIGEIISGFVGRATDLLPARAAARAVVLYVGIRSARSYVQNRNTRAEQDPSVRVTTKFCYYSVSVAVSVSVAIGSRVSVRSVSY